MQATPELRYCMLQSNKDSRPWSEKLLRAAFSEVISMKSFRYGRLMYRGVERSSSARNFVELSGISGGRVVI